MSRAWTAGPLAAMGEHKSEHGKFVYAVRETEPRGQIAGYPTPTARYRNRADAQIGALAPEMAEIILDVVDGCDLDPSHPCICSKEAHIMAFKLRAIDKEQA